MMHAWVVSPDDAVLCLPDGATCGQVSNRQMSGAYTSPGYPFYQHNLDCAYVIRAPNGYGIQLIIHNFDIEKRYTIMYYNEYRGRHTANFQSIRIYITQVLKSFPKMKE